MHARQLRNGFPVRGKRLPTKVRPKKYASLPYKQFSICYSTDIYDHTLTMGLCIGWSSSSCFGKTMSLRWRVVPASLYLTFLDRELVQQLAFSSGIEQWNLANKMLTLSSSIRIYIYFCWNRLLSKSCQEILQKTTKFMKKNPVLRPSMHDNEPIRHGISRAYRVLLGTSTTFVGIE